MDVWNAKEYFNHKSIVQYSMKINFVMQKGCGFNEDKKSLYSTTLYGKCSTEQP